MVSQTHKMSASLLAMAECVVAAILAKVRAVTHLFEIPDGYEDTTGFHFGSPDAKERE